MANVLIEEETMKSIGKSIRGKNGETTLYLPKDMPAKIDAIEGGGSTNLGNLVTFNVDGQPYQISTVKQGTKLSEPIRPTKEGLKFIGWNKGVTGVSFPYTPIEKEETLDANFGNIQFVKWIRGTGTQYIDSLYVPTTNTKIEATFTSLEGAAKCLGGLKDHANHGSIVFNKEGNKWQFFWREYSKPKVTIEDVAVNERRTMSLENGKVIYNGQEYTFPKSEITNIKSLYILAFYYTLYGGSSYLSEKINLHDFKIYENDVVVRDYRPFYDVDTTQYGLYETIENKKYFNAGTGDILGGND